MLLLTLSSKLLIYIGLAMAIGGVFISFLASDQAAFKRFTVRYVQLGIVVSLIALCVNFLVQVGHFAEAGWRGMFDPTYIQIMWESSVGTSVLLRALGLVALLISLVFMQHLKFIQVICAALLAATFALSGHTSEHAIAIRLMLSLHVLIGLLWVGSLLPLWQSCRVLESARLKRLMQQFGAIATVFVAVLIGCGGIIAWQLFDSFSTLFTTTYGQIFLLKLMAVSSMLGLAALHKWRFVPTLADAKTANHLKRSILLEALIALIVLTLTVLMTTITGPEAMMGHHSH